MVDIIEGKRASLEALKSGMPVKRLVLADNLEHDGLVRDILRKARNAGIPVKEMPRKKVDMLSPGRAHQGVVVEAAPFPYADLTDVISKADEDAENRDGRALVVVCDHLTDAGNLGAVARSAESVGASGIIIPNKRAASVTAATYKSSAGAIAHLPIAQVANLATVIEKLKDVGFWVVGATEHSDDSLWQTDLKGRIALCLGSEHDGLSRLTMERCDFLAALPQVGEISSLNVAQAGTVFMCEWLRQNMQ